MESNHRVATKLIDLNLDCMLRILSYCSEEDLLNLCRVHHHLRNIIDKHIFYLKTLDALMCGHRDCTRTNKRYLGKYTLICTNFNIYNGL